MMLNPVSRSGVILGLFAVCTVAFIAITAAGTAKVRAHNAEMAERKSLYQLVPAKLRDNDLLRDTVMAPPGGLLGNESVAPIHVARQGARITAVVLPVTAPDGYSGRIRMLVGLTPDGTLLGVRVVEHRETPGLGDKVDLRKSDWILGFTGRSLDDPQPAGWQVRKEGGAFDQFTGATITPRAVVRAVYRALRHYEAHATEILGGGDQEAST